MASAVMASPTNLSQQTQAAVSSPALNSPRRNLKRPAPVSAGPSSRPMIPSIKTPGLAVRSPLLPSDKMLPSQLPRSPASPWSAGIKNDALKTPITPPSAYADFLTALSPAMSTPATARSSYSTFSFTDRNGHLTPITQPPSAASFSGHSANASKRRAPPAFPTTMAAPPSLTATSAPLVPPSPFVRPSITRRSSSARSTTSLKKLTIPDSPSFSPITESAGNSAISLSRTPASASKPRSALAFTATPTELRSPFSPTSWYQEGRTRTVTEPKSAGAMQTVSVRQVVTRTVTYTRTPLEPAPKRRRRRGPGEAATPIDPRLMPFSMQKAKSDKVDEDAQSEYTTASSVTGSSVTDGTDSSDRRSEKEGSADTAVMVKVEAPTESAEVKS